MDLKSFLKIMKLNESRISMLLGAAIIVIIGTIVVRYFRSLDTGTTFPTGVSTEQEGDAPGSYTVKEGDTLWSISEEVYGTGYNWTDIRDANELSASGEVEIGMELTIPTPTATATSEPTEEPEIEEIEEEIVDTEVTQDELSGKSYTVVRGDNLWDICVKIYDDGYMWTKVAQLNDLANPQIIHAGNVFQLP